MAAKVQSKLPKKRGIHQKTVTLSERELREIAGAPRHAEVRIANAANNEAGVWRVRRQVMVQWIERGPEE